MAVCDGCGREAAPVRVAHSDRIDYVLDLESIGWTVRSRPVGVRCPPCRERILVSSKRGFGRKAVA
jgi:DNA-directed RNA polymerase subunit RPC12/RpoP